jgi:hypothetical protein
VQKAVNAFFTNSSDPAYLQSLVQAAQAQIYQDAPYAWLGTFGLWLPWGGSIVWKTGVITGFQVAPVWTGQATRHVRAGLADDLSLERLRRVWMAISPIAYAEKLARWPKKSLFIFGRYDLTFLPDFSRQIIAESRRLHLDTKVAVLPCGHYTSGETPFKFLDAYYMASFLDSAFSEV